MLSIIKLIKKADTIHKIIDNSGFKNVFNLLFFKMIYPSNKALSYIKYYQASFENYRLIII